MASLCCATCVLDPRAQREEPLVLQPKSHVRAAWAVSPAAHGALGAAWHLPGEAHAVLTPGQSTLERQETRRTPDPAIKPVRVPVSRARQGLRTRCPENPDTARPRPPAPGAGVSFVYL